MRRVIAILSTFAIALLGATVVAAPSSAEDPPQITTGGLQGAGGDYSTHRVA